jgi:hypothetical protein
VPFFNRVRIHGTWEEHERCQMKSTVKAAFQAFTIYLIV